MDKWFLYIYSSVPRLLTAVILLQTNILKTAFKPLKAFLGTELDFNRCMQLRLVARCVYCNGVSKMSKLKTEDICNKKNPFLVALIGDIKCIKLSSSPKLQNDSLTLVVPLLCVYLTTPFHFLHHLPLLFQHWVIPFMTGKNSTEFRHMHNSVGI